MAATLIHIKSQNAAAAGSGAGRDLAEEDPRQELVERLLEHERFKNAAEMLQQKLHGRGERLVEPADGQFLSRGTREPELAVTLFDLVKTLQGVLERAKNRPIYEVGKEDVSVPDMILHLRIVARQAVAKANPCRSPSCSSASSSRRAMVCPVSGHPGDGEDAGRRADPEGRFRRHRHRRSTSAFDEVFAAAKRWRPSRRVTTSWNGNQRIHSRGAEESTPGNLRSSRASAAEPTANSWPSSKRSST